LSAVIRELERRAPSEVRDAYAQAIERELPEVRRTLPYREKAPNANAPHLRDSVKLVDRGARAPSLVIDAPHANTIQWGRKTLRGFPSVVKGRPTVWATLAQGTDRIQAELKADLDRRLDRLT
jgi:hypothetical protein